MDRFAIVSGHYWWYADHHDGQASPEYARLCRISRYYKPALMANGPDSEEAQDVYDALCHRHGCTHGTE